MPDPEFKREDALHRSLSRFKGHLSTLKLHDLVGQITTRLELEKAMAQLVASDPVVSPSAQPEPCEPATGTASRLLSEVIQPRLRAPINYFPDLRFELLSGKLACMLRLNTSEYITADCVLVVSIQQRGAADLSVGSRVTLSPDYMALAPPRELTFHQDQVSFHEVAEFVEDEVLAALAVYRRLRTDPRYRQEVTVIDPVCAMEVHPLDAPASYESEAGHYFFCSTACEVAFKRSPGRYVPTRGTSQ